MTYCVAVRNEAGLVFLSDSRTNAGVDQISTFRKMHVYEVPGERVMVLLTAGNLAISQSVASGLKVQMESHAEGSETKNLATTNPRPITAMPVRSQARSVRSAAK